MPRAAQLIGETVSRALVAAKQDAQFRTRAALAGVVTLTAETMSQTFEYVGKEREVETERDVFCRLERLYLRV